MAKRKTSKRKATKKSSPKKKAAKHVNDGKAFERAVYAFANSFGGGARVSFNVQKLDRDTGAMRQCDVWIDANLGHYQIGVLISCKDHKRPIDIGEIEKFAGEVASVGAQLGVIYSTSGFTKQAIKKARKKSVNCCVLYDNKPAQIPEILSLRASVCQTRLSITPLSDPIDGITKWSEILSLPTDDAELPTVLDFMAHQFTEKETASLEGIGPGKLPQPWSGEIIATDPNGKEIRIRLSGIWRYFAGKTEYHLFSGSYSLTDGGFLGTLAFPVINRHDSHPGIAWTEINEREAAKFRVLAVRCGFDFRDSVIDAIGNRYPWQPNDSDSHGVLREPPEKQ